MHFPVCCANVIHLSLSLYSHVRRRCLKMGLTSLTYGTCMSPLSEVGPTCATFSPAGSMSSTSGLQSGSSWRNQTATLAVSLWSTSCSSSTGQCPSRNWLLELIRLATRDHSGTRPAAHNVTLNVVYLKQMTFRSVTISGLTAILCTNLYAH